MTNIHSAFCALFECNLSTVCIYLTAWPSGLSGHLAAFDGLQVIGSNSTWDNTWNVYKLLL